MSVRHLIQEAAALINAARSVAPIVAVISENGPRDGVTTVSCGLAAELVAMRRSVAVADCDFLDPQLHERLGQPLGLGMGAVLAGDAHIDHVFNYSSMSANKFLTVTAGEHHDQRVPLLSAPTAPLAIQRLTELSDIVLLNGAPLTTPAGQALVALVDAVILVVDAHPASGPDQRPTMLQSSRPYVAARVVDPGAVLRPRDAVPMRFDAPVARKLTHRVTPPRRPAHLVAATATAVAPPQQTVQPVAAIAATPVSQPIRSNEGSGLMTQERATVSTVTAAPRESWPVANGVEKATIPPTSSASKDLPGYSRSGGLEPIDDQESSPRILRFLRPTRGRYLD